MTVTKYLNIKNGIELLHDDGTTQILAGAFDPSGIGMAATVGSLFLKGQPDGGLYFKCGIGVTDWLLVSSASSVATMSGTLQAQLDNLVEEISNITGTTVSGGITEEQHTFLHNRERYLEYNRIGNKVNSIDEWSDDTKTCQISSVVLNRLGSRVTSFTKELYDNATGTVVVSTVSGTIDRVGGKVSSIKYTRDNLMGGY